METFISTDSPPVLRRDMGTTAISFQLEISNLFRKKHTYFRRKQKELLSDLTDENSLLMRECYLYAQNFGLALLKKEEVAKRWQYTIDQSYTDVLDRVMERHFADIEYKIEANVAGFLEKTYKSLSDEFVLSGIAFTDYLTLMQNIKCTKLKGYPNKPIEFSGFAKNEDSIKNIFAAGWQGIRSPIYFVISTSMISYMFFDVRMQTLIREIFKTHPYIHYTLTIGLLCLGAKSIFDHKNTLLVSLEEKEQDFKDTAKKALKRLVDVKITEYKRKFDALLEDNLTVINEIINEEIQICCKKKTQSN